MSKPQRPLWLTCVRALGSLKLATTLYLLLMVLTFAGTLEQQHTSLYDVQAKFFESAIFVWWAGGSVPIPLLGGYLLLSVLFVNLLVGGVIRLRHGTRTIGILIAHLGILSLLAGSFVEHQFSTKGQLTLYENEVGDEYQSVHEWEVVVTAPRSEGVTEYVIPWDSFRGIGPGERVEWVHEALPFKVVLSDMTVNGQPQPANPGEPASIDGFVLRRLKPEGTGGRVNVPALIATLHPTDGSASSRTILWGLQQHPWDPTIGEVRYLIDLRRQTHAMPFSVRLDRFEHETYPGIGMAKRYSSFVTKIDGGTQERVHITMNEPLRWRGYTLYQSDFGPKPEERAPEGTPKYSVFSVVQNPSDQWPKWMAWVIAIGMLIHFSMKLAKYLSKEERRRAASVSLVLLALALPGCGTETPTEAPWSDEVVATMAKVPVQAEGRVKPLSTWAAFALLGLNEKRSCLDADENTIKSTPWLLDAAFRPAWARKHVCFEVPTDEILVAIGHAEIAKKKKRDRYSYEELATPEARAQLRQLAEKYTALEPKDRSRVQSGIVELNNALALFEGLTSLFDWARADYPLGDPALEALFEGRTEVTFTDVLARSEELIQRAQRGMGSKATGEEATPEATAIGILLMAAFGKAERTLRVGFFPPASDAPEDDKTWMSLRDVSGYAFMRGSLAPKHLEILTAMQSMARDPANRERFAAAAATWQSTVRDMSEPRGEYDQIEREVHLYAFNPLGKAQFFYLLAFLMVALTWLRPGVRWLRLSAVGLTVIALGMHTYGIVLRCIIRSRPPISTLYETIIFIAATAVIALLAIEGFNRRRVALAIAPVLGSLGLFVADGYEVLNGGDTMPQLVAVLDTNFWLMTHVTCISIGYMGGLAAAAIAHVYIVAKAVKGSSLSGEFYRSIASMVYGVLCFALLFSLVGTILGGIWANDSWGRFWGWDPKENGALLIVLSILAILHARMAGLIKAFGMCMSAVVCGMIVAFSWWGVNLLGIGLHSYGFTSGILNALLTFYAIEAAVLLVGCYALLRAGGGAGASMPPPTVEGRSSS